MDGGEVRFLALGLPGLIDDLREGMGEAWRLREKNRKVLEEQNKNNE